MSAIELIPEIEHCSSKTDLLAVNLRPAVELCADRTVGIVIACPDLASRDRRITLVLRKGFEPMLASTLREAILLLEHEEIALVICQASFDDGDFRELLRSAARIGPGSDHRVRRLVRTRGTRRSNRTRCLRLSHMSFSTRCGGRDRRQGTGRIR